MIQLDQERQKYSLPLIIIHQLSQQLNIPQQTLKHIFSQTLYDQALGALFGSMMGDALGSYCQFKTEVSTDELKKAMTMPGGGPHNTYPGQVTDDSQMAFHLLEALCLYDEEKPFVQVGETISLAIAKGYVKWAQSGPFDIGNTVSSGIRSLFQRDAHIDMEHLRQAFLEIRGSSRESISNGYLMRNVPMAIFVALMKKFHGEEEHRVEELVLNEIKMTHHHEACLDSGQEWVNLLASLILRRNKTKTLPDMYRRFQERDPKTYELLDWKNQCKENQLMGATENMGYARIAFTYGITYFRRITQNFRKPQDLDAEVFKEIMAGIIKRGGDTDTNAAIVGGMLGSLIGFKNLPNEYKQIQLNLNLGRGPKKTDRPTFYEPRNALYLFLKLVSKFVK